MVFNYYYNLTRKQQFIYRKSDQIETVNLNPQGMDILVIDKLREALTREDRKTVSQCTAKIVNLLAANLEIHAVKIRVLSVRPSYHYGELHGLYEPAEGNDMAVITVWMRTVKHKRVVAFKTYLRTVLHEFCHHLDYEYYKLADSYHTEGFFKRESSLLKQLLPDGG